MLSLLPEMFFTQSSGLCLHVTSSLLSPWAQSKILNFALVISVPLGPVMGLFIQFFFYFTKSLMKVDISFFYYGIPHV